MQDFTLKKRIYLYLWFGVVELRKKTVRLLAVFLFLTFLNVAPCHLAAGSRTADLDVFEEILGHVVDLHISRPDPGALIEGAIEGLLDTLGDPYAEYLPPVRPGDSSDYFDDNYAGVGIHMQPGNDYPKVIGVIDYTPADKAGLQPGDLVVKVDGVDVAKEPLGEIVHKIRGPAGTYVRLTVRREGAGDMDFKIMRAIIDTPTVSGTFLDNDTGYIYISTFGKETGNEFRRMLEDQIRRGATKLILDLRDNPGGIVCSAIEVCGNFIEPGQVVVSAINRSGDREDYGAEGNPAGRGMRVAVLVNQNSASSSEILAGALQDYGAAALVGSRTYGKGTMQAVVQLDAGGALKITTDKCRTPKGRAIEGSGLNPDIQVLTPELVEVVALQYLNQQNKRSVTFNTSNAGSVVNGSVIGAGRVLQRGDAVYLPLRFIFETFGYRVDWQTEDCSIRITGNGTEAVCYPENGRVSLNGEVFPGLGDLVSENGDTFISVSSLPLFSIKVKFEGDKIIVEN